MIDRLYDYVRSEAARRGIPGAAFAVVRGDEVLIARGVGATRAEGGAPVTPETLFQVGSVTKSITAAAILQLRDQGLLDLDAPVQRYLPWFAVADMAASSQITVRHLLNQTSGLPYAAWKVGLFNPGLRKSRRKAVRALQFMPPAAAPGARFAYSNMNYEVLGEVITALSGQPYDAYVAEHVFAPLGMGSSTYDSRQALSRSYAHPHLKEFGRIKELPVEPGVWGAASGLALFSSANDMARYLSAQLGGGAGLLAPASLAEAHAGAVEAMAGTRYGLGWMVRDFYGESLVFHAGLTAGSNAIVCLLPDRNLGLVLMVNCVGGAAEAIATNLLRMLQGAEPGARSVLPDLTAAPTVAAGVIGAAGLGLLAGLAFYAGRPIGMLGASVWSLALLFLLVLPGRLRRSWAFPLPVPLGRREWPAELALGWRVLLLGVLAWAVYAWA